MLTPASQLMPLLQPVVNPQSMTISLSDFFEAPCKQCGELVPTRWDEPQKQWFYEGICWTCENRRAKLSREILNLKASGLTSEELKLTLDSVIITDDNQAAYDAAKRLAGGEMINLYLAGAAGRGKSRLAIGVVISRIQSAKVRFMPVTRTLMEIRSGLRDSSEDEYIQKLLTYNILVLDDFGATKLTEWNLSFLDCLIDEWYRQRRKGLIVTSNFNLKDVSEKISDRIASRLAQMCEVYTLTGKDWRLS